MHLFVAGTLGIVGYMTSHSEIAAYLDIFHLPVGGEVTAVFCAALVGAGLGFLWYNGIRRKSLWEILDRWHSVPHLER